MYYIYRNNKQFGPYDIDTIAHYVTLGKVLKCDKAAEVLSPDNVRTVNYFLRLHGRRVKVPSKGNLWEQIRAMGSSVILPKSVFNPKELKSNNTLIVLAAVGLLPMLFSVFTFSDFLTFYSISLYFSTIWGLFFYYLFKTKQVTIRTTLTLFFLEQAVVFFAWSVTNVALLNPFYHISRGFLFFFLGVGLTEELAKALPLLLILKRAKEPLIPQTMVFYGLMSGIAFGVFEGVEYQMTVNTELGYSASFFANVARLTSTPFIHAVFSAIAGYFLSFAVLYPRYRKSLYLLAIAIPALMHGLYDTACGWGFVGYFVRVGLLVFAVSLLVVYLKQGSDLQSKLRE